MVVGIHASEPRVLVVDDEPMVREVLTNYLQADGFSVVTAADGAEAVARFDDPGADLVVLDVMLPQLDGLGVLDHIRSHADPDLRRVPVIMLTARGQEEDRVSGLDQGADDYVVKPFSPREVTARVRSVLRRAIPVEPGSVSELEPVRFGDVEIDRSARRVRRDGEPVELTRLEFDLLVYLATRPGQVVSRDEVLQAVWNSSIEWQDPATVTVHVRRLRQKLEADPTDPRHLVAVYGIGYRFEQ